MHVLWNESLSEIFISTRGVRQGDPFSIYHFLLGMEQLGHLIEAAIEGGSWEPLMLSRRGLAISRLLFADGLVLFCKKDVKGAYCLKQVLNTSYHFSGHRVKNRRLRFSSLATCLKRQHLDCATKWDLLK